LRDNYAAPIMVPSRHWTLIQIVAASHPQRRATHDLASGTVPVYSSHTLIVFSADEVGELALKLLNVLSHIHWCR